MQQHGAAADVSRRLLTALPHRTTVTLPRHALATLAAAQRQSQQLQAIGHIDVRRTADWATPQAMRHM